MKLIRSLIGMMILIMFGAAGGAAATIDTDTFGVDLENWSGTGVSRSSSDDTMLIDSQSVATKTFTSTYANSPVSLTLTLTKSGTWEADDTAVITINGTTVHSSNTTGTMTFNAVTNSSGSVAVTIKANTNAVAERLKVDDITLVTGAYYNNSYTRTFQQAYTVNAQENIKMIGNSAVYDAATGGCAPVHTNNNSYPISYADRDDDGATFNSTSATLALPAGASKIKYAALFWQGRTQQSATVEAGRGIKVKLSGFTAYQTASSAASKFNWITQDVSGIAGNTTGKLYSYQGVADITSLLQADVDSADDAVIAATGYSAPVWVADLQTEVGMVQALNGYGSWSLVVVYEDAAGQLRNISVYDGYLTVQNSTVSQTLSGFYTPTTGDVNSQFFLYGGEGDYGQTDTVTLTNNSGTAVALGTDIFQSTITDIAGANITTRDPSCENAIGADIHSFDIGTNGATAHIIQNGQSSTVVSITSTSDGFFPGVFAFATDIYQPNICYYENIFRGLTNISGVGTQVNKNDVLTVRVYLKNKGNENAEGVKILHPFDQAKFPYVEGSANYNNASPTYQTTMPPTYPRTSATDGADGDIYTYSSASYLSTINVGSGATSSSGGTFYPESSATPTFAVFEYNATVRVTDSNYTNVYKAAYVNSALGIDYSSNPVTIKTCEGVPNSFWAPYVTGVSANVDVVDGYSGTGGSYDSWITTKVSNKGGYTLNAVYLGTEPTNPTPQAYTPSGNQQQAASVTVLFKLADVSGGETCENAPTVPLFTTIGGNTPVVAIIDPGETAAASNAFVMGYLNAGSTTPLAKKAVRVKYKAIDFNQLILDSGIQCAQRSSTGGVVEGIPACLIAQPNDNTENQNKAIQNYTTIFGINAYNQCYTQNGEPCAASNGGVGLPPYDHEYGCFECSIGAMPYTCSKDSFAIRPEKLEIESTHYDMPNLLRAGEEYNTAIHAYNYGTTNDSAGYNVLSANSVYIPVATKFNRNNVVTPSMAGTLAFGANDFNMTNGVSTRAGSAGNEVAGLTFDDVGKINISLQDQLWAAVDIGNGADTTPRDCSADGAYVCSNKNVTFIPYNFDFDQLTITNNNGNPGTFTYIANEKEKMGGRIETTMRALNKSGNVTQNFATTPLWENPVTVIPTVVVDATKYLYPAANETQITNLAIHFGSGTKTIPWNETNTSQYLRFNFQRGHDLPRNSFEVEGDELSMALTSVYTDPTDGDTATVSGSRDGTVSPASGGARFVYGRIIPRDVRVFGNVAFDAYGWYEVYNIANLGGTVLAPSRNEPKWYINRLHDDAPDGDANVTIVSPTIANTSMPVTSNLGTPPNTGMETYHFNAIGTANIPYSGKAHISTDPWLWYGLNTSDYLAPSSTNLDCLTHPCFNINVAPSVGATGSAQQGAASEKASKRTDEGTGWKSTSDYAPAVR